MNHPLREDRLWPDDVPAVDTPVEIPAESDPLIRELLEGIARGNLLRGDASPPVREIRPQSDPRPHVAGDPWRRGGGTAREE